MADNFEARIGANNWRSSSKSAFSGGSPPCLTGYSDIGGQGWPASDMIDVKGIFSDEPNSVSGITFDFPRAQKDQTLDSASTMGFSLSSSPNSDWNQILLNRGNGRTESSLKSLFLEDMVTNVNHQREEPIRIGKDWSPEDFSTVVEDDNSIASNIFESVDQAFYSAGGCLSSDLRSGDDHDFSAGFPNGSASTLLQSLLNSQTRELNFLDKNRLGNSFSFADFGSNYDELSSPLPKTSISQHRNVDLCFSKSESCWNSSLSDAKPELKNFTAKKLQLHAGEDVQQSGIIWKRVNGGEGDLAFKRPRIETSPPLPTFKVRKEKLGDRITALQQLVSPFGKTDTASVLHEAIDYIKFLHEQVSVLSTPYMKSGASDHQQKEPQEATKELRNRGLCLVPISGTFAAPSETTPEFWTPTFGATFK